MIPQLCLSWKGQLGRFRNDYTLSHTAPCGDGANLSTWEKMAVRLRTRGEIKHSWDSSTSAAQKEKQGLYTQSSFFRAPTTQSLSELTLLLLIRDSAARVRLHTVIRCCQFKSSHDDDDYRSSVDLMFN